MSVGSRPTDASTAGPTAGCCGHGATLLDVSEAQRAEAERETLIRELEARTRSSSGSPTRSHTTSRARSSRSAAFSGIIRKDVEEGRTDRLEGDVGRMARRRTTWSACCTSCCGCRGSAGSRTPRSAYRSRSSCARPWRSYRRDSTGAGSGSWSRRPCPRSTAIACGSSRWSRTSSTTPRNSSATGPIRGFASAAAWPPLRRGRCCSSRTTASGIEPRFQEKVFGLFLKLDPKAEGSGVGLALVRRIVEVHGGRVWIESEGRDRGTTVCFTLPEPPPPGQP